MGAQMNEGSAPMMENKDYVRAHHAKLREYKVRPYKEEGEAIGEYAKAMGMSVQGLFLEAVREYMSNHPKENEQRKET